MPQVYHRTTPHQHHRRNSTGTLPLRIYLVLKYLRAALPPGAAVNVSNAAITAAVGYGSEGEVSQVMRWLAGELPLSGRWAHRYLDAPQRLRYIARERRPDGGYTTTLLVVPTPIALSDHDPLDDPQPSRPRAESTHVAHDPPVQLSFFASERDTGRIEGDHAIESEFMQTQEQESAPAHDCSVEDDPLYQRLMREPNMSRALARRVAAQRLGTLDEFERDLALAQAMPTIASPLYFTVARWRDGQRVVAQERSHDRPSSPAHGQHRTQQRRRRAERSGSSRGAASSGPVDPAVYERIIAEARPLDIDLDDL